MTIRFIANCPALSILEERILVVADLHVGLEHQLYQSGIIIAPQAEKFYKEIDKLIKITQAEKLVIIGDLKHKVPGISFREIREIPKLLEPLAEKTKIFLCHGNHDSDLKGLIPESVEVYDSHGFSIGPYGFFHGHAWPAKELLKCDYLFTAHIHPTVEFVDDFGFRIVEKVWAKGTLDEKILRKKYSIGSKRRKGRGGEFKFGKLETIIFPAFNPIISGMPLNSPRRADEGYLGPLMKSGALKPQKMEAYMLDGTHLGKIKTLK